MERRDRGLAIGVKREGRGRSATDVTRRVGGRKHREGGGGENGWLVWSRAGEYESAGGGGECTGTRGYCLTGIGIDRPRDAMERVAEGCWSILRDVKSIPPTLTPPGYFFSPLA